MISVCMPYFDRQQQLNRSLKSLRALYDDIEIVIADDGSPIPVEAEGCKVVSLPQKDHALNPCVPINLAVAASSGDVIVLTNPEIEHRAPVLYEMRKRLKRNSYVTAACRDVTTGQWLAKSGVQNGKMPLPEGSQLHFCAMFHRSTWDKVGGFDEYYREGQAVEDTDWLWALQNAGVKFIHCDDLVVFHHRSNTSWPAGGLQRNQHYFLKKWGLSPIQ